MFGNEAVIILFVVRLALPVGFMLWLGERERRRQSRFDFR